MPITFDPNDEKLGTDIAKLTDLAPVHGIARGKLNLAYANARRLNTPRGAIPYFPDYGKYLPALVEKSLRQGSLAVEAGEIAAELEKDPRNQAVDVNLVFSFEARTLTIAIMTETADGPFEMVFEATSVTVEVLRVGGIAVPAVVVPPMNIVVRAGERGPKGDAGATGGGGGGGGGADLEEGTDEQLGDDGGIEVVVWEEPVDFGEFDATITVAFVTRVLSDAGTGTFRVRIGGTTGTANGTIVGQVTTVSPTFEDAQDDSGVISNPTGTIPLKVTILSSGAGVFARLDGFTVTVR
jgi:hypothetical protein